MTPESLRSYLRSRLPAGLDLLRAMVGINSFTPNVAGIAALGDLTAQAFAPLGFEATRIPSDNPEYGQHLFLSKPGKSGQWISFISHLDTVYPAEEEVVHDFHWGEDATHVRGPGVSDIKGGTVVAWLVLDVLQALAPAVFDQLGVLVALDAAEERLGVDFARLVRERLDPATTRGILVMEAGGDYPGPTRLVVCRKGMANFTVDVTGKAAHSGTGYWNGDNAILTAAELARRLAELSDRAKDLTVNVGVLAGGTVTNRVPHACQIRGEVRSFEPAVLAEAMTRMEHLVEATGKARIVFTHQTRGWPTKPATESLFMAFRSAGTQLGMRIEREHRGGLSDGNMLWEHAPTIDGLGPVGGNCHCSQRGPDGTGQEYALKASFPDKAALIALMVHRLAGPD